MALSGTQFQDVEGVLLPGRASPDSASLGLRSLHRVRAGALLSVRLPGSLCQLPLQFWRLGWKTSVLGGCEDREYVGTARLDSA